ncbi:hypothetical protein HWI92_19970 [Dyadobacter sandarakinus]|uniref:Uncharacterized protein n=1 Tax=Dyadobacter sandarakinus TaxID=2747268 RepID=A0ABX7IDQ7_9BACT|nr:hypothetical protein HWI92_19970 [Dyadobacter sandarakinus]
MLATLLVLAAGARTWSDYAQPHASDYKAKKALAGHAQKAPAGDNEQAKFSAQSLDAVITPAISFDFAHYFYFTPQPAWQFVVALGIAKTSYRETFFLFTYFHRIFGRYIVTNAP